MFPQQSFSSANNFNFNTVQVPPAASTIAPNFPLRPATNQSVSQEPGISYTEDTNFIVISSNDRNTTNYPNPNYYRITFDTPYRNVKRVELVSAVIPDQASTGSILSQPILNILIDELNHVDNSNGSINKAFAVLPLKGPSSSGKFIVPELGAAFNMPRDYPVPLASLSSLTISIVDLAGTRFNFGADSAPPTLSLQNVFVFRVTTEEKNRSVLQYRNVY